jgi:hypothetical protein
MNRAPSTRIAGCEIAALILLAGSVRPSPFAAALGRSILDLPLGEGKTILSQWIDEAAELARPRATALPLRVVADARLPAPASGHGTEAIRLSVETEQVQYRGTAGLLADLCAGYPDDQCVLVANAAQVPRVPLAEQAEMLAAEVAEVAVLCPRDGVPSHLMLLTCGVLREVPPVGFIDLKEQFLPKVSAKARVRPVFLEQAGSPSIRTLHGYIATLRDRQLRRGGRHPEADPYAETWAPAFNIVEEGAEVSAGARLYDAVVLAGARVAEGATVVRSVVAPGGVVRRRDFAVDRVIAGPAVSANGGSAR